ncbi:hypothetical protein CR513_10070, partial [Mucuna pruriens]
MFVPNYSTKFEELSRYFPHYQSEDGEHSKCVKFINGLCPKIKQFPVLVNRMKIAKQGLCITRVWVLRGRRGLGAKSAKKPYYVLPSGKSGNY